MKTINDSQVTRKTFFKEVYEDNFDLIYKFVFVRLSGNTGFTEDIVHDIFFEAIQSADSFKNKSTFKTWLFGIAKHKISDYYKRAARSVVIGYIDEEIVAYDPKNIEDEFIAIENSDYILKALNNINEGYRCFLIMKYIDDYSLKEISKITGRTIKSVDGILQRAKSEFKKQYCNLFKIEGIFKNP